jgi:branched-chain amino acid transport system ATP-binding protein
LPIDTIVSEGAPLLALDNVTVRFGGLTAVAGVSFNLQAGEVCAVIGPNGAGKTTLFNAISGNVVVSAGIIRLQGKPIQNLPPHIISARGVRRTFQNGGLFGELLGGRKSLAAEADATHRARDLLALLQIEHLADRPARLLSGGQQRMVEIVRALATEPPLLLLDEPAVGLAPPMRTQLGAIIRRLAAEQGIAILLIEHAIELVMNVSDRVIVMSDGHKVADAAPDVVRADRAVLEAYLGHA